MAMNERRWNGSGVSRRKFLSGAGTTAAGAALLMISKRAAADDHAHAKLPRPTCIAVDTTFAQAFSSDDEGKLIFYDVDDTVEPARLVNPQPFTKPHSGKASYVALKDTLVLTSGYDGYVFLYDRTNHSTPPAVFDKHIVGSSQPEVWVVTLSKNGNRALSATNDGTILLWDTSNRATIAKFIDSDSHGVNNDPIGGLAFVPNGGGEETMFLSTHGHGQINLWNIADPTKPLREFWHGNRHAVNAVAVFGDGTRFISAGLDMTLRLWDLRNQTLLKTLRGHTNWVWRVAISDDNKRAVSAGEDGRAMVWDLEQPGNELTPIQVIPPLKCDPFPDGVMGVAFTANRTVVVTVNASSNPNPLAIERVN